MTYRELNIHWLKSVKGQVLQKFTANRFTNIALTFYLLNMTHPKTGHHSTKMKMNNIFTYIVCHLRHDV